MWYIAGRFFGLVTKHACDRQTDRQNYNYQGRTSIAASRGNKRQCARRSPVLSLWLARWTSDSMVASSIPAAAANTWMGDRLRAGKPPQYFTEPPRPTQPPSRSGTENAYRPKCGDALRMGSKGRYGSFHLNG